jgi:hypothetical protein
MNMEIDRDNDRDALVVTNRGGEHTRRIMVEVASSLVHAGMVSIFETIFFWTYIVPHERIVLLRYQDELGAIVSAACSDTSGLILAPEAQALGPLFGAILQPEDNRTTSKNNMCMRTSVHLSILFCVGALAASVASARFPPQTTPPPTTRRIVASCTASLISIGIYEYMFFDLVVSQFQPLSTTHLISAIFAQCTFSQP